MTLPYQQPGLTLSRAGSAQPDMVRSLQRHLRVLGYKGAGINGVYDNATERAVRSLQIDLLKPTQPAGSSSGISHYNSDTAGGARVTAVTGIVDQALAGCIGAMLADAQFAELPESDNAAGDNTRALAAIRTHTGSVAPSPFVVAIVQQESSGRHYLVPRAGDEDAFVTIGLDRNSKTEPDEITSRGYGLGQYTLEHHPPTAGEVRDFIRDPSTTFSGFTSCCERNSIVPWSDLTIARMTGRPSIRCCHSGYVAMHPRTPAICRTARIAHAPHAK